MTVSRWKVMAGVIGLSIGGLAAIAGQGSKSDESPRAEEPAKAEAPNAAPPSSSAPTRIPPTDLPRDRVDVVPPTLPVIVALVPPAVPVLPPSSPYTPPALPAPVIPASVPVVAGPVPTLPLPKTKPSAPEPPKPVDVSAVPPKETTPGLIPAGASVNHLEIPFSSVIVPMPSDVGSKPPVPPKGPLDGLLPALPDLSEKAPTAPVIAPTSPYSPPPPALPIASSDPLVADPKPAPVAVAAVQSKFRIVLRVGEGEPTFEVRHGDDLVMKVKCDKVDIKSPDKGHGLTNVIATGKVHFVGFGAEGTCDSLSFLAGSGEVEMHGQVNVKVRDKIGRVESELSAETMKYKLDQTALGGVLKP